MQQTPTDETELIAQSRQGNHDAYCELVDRYKDALYRHCFVIVRDEDAAEDITQDTLITAYYKLNSYNSTYRFATWLFKIASNKALNYLRQPSRRVVIDDKIMASIATTLPGPHTQAEYGELRQAVEHLQPKYRAVIDLYYWQGLAYQEVAIAMDAPLGSIKVWMAKAKEQLRKELS